MAVKTYVSCEENGRAYAEKIAESYRRNGCDAKVEHGQIPVWGSSDRTTSGYRIIVDDHKTYKRII